MKKHILIHAVCLLGCSKNCHDKTDKTLEAKNKTIDSLKTELQDCKAQAKIMADVLANDK